jgi:hypothetical protein
MSIYVAPNATFEAVAANFPTGIVGTIGVRLVDNSGATVTARTTAGITEHPAASGIYAVTLTSPVVAGQYSVVWDTGGSDVSWAVEEVVVTITPQQVVGLSPTVTNARLGMTNIINNVRSLTYAGTAEFTLGTVSYFTDGHIQDILDRHRVDVFRERLERVPNYDGSGTVTYTTHYSGYKNLEAGTALFIEDSAGVNRGSATYSVDYQVGRIDFASDVAGTTLYMTAKSYDPFGAAAEVLESWAASEARSFDFTTDGQSFSRKQKADGLREQARALRKRARVIRKRLLTGGH